MSGVDGQAKSARDRIGVVVVTYHPIGDVEARLKGMAALGRAMVVVDNASGPEARARIAALCGAENWVLVGNPANLGLGVALNQGARRVAEAGCEWILFFDQDSEPAADLGERLLETAGRWKGAGELAVVGAVFEEPKTGRRHRFLRRHPRVPFWFQKIEVADGDLEVSMVITSGSMVRARVWEELGGFDEGFFIDYIDTDFCLRCRERGGRVIASAAARFEHALGARTQARWGGITMEATHHPAPRHYYIARNRVAMWRRHAWRQVHWAVFDFCAAGLWLARVLTVEKSKAKKVKAMVLGTWDGLRGRRGGCPPARAKELSA